MNNYWIKKEYVEEVERDDVDDIAINKLLPGDWYEESYGTHTTNKQSYSGVSDAMNIDDMFSVLNNLKEKGSTHIEVMYHIDHRGYVFNGLIMQRATEEEIQNFENEIKEKSKNKTLTGR